MLKLFDLKKPGANAGSAGGNPPRIGPSAANLRIQKGMYIIMYVSDPKLQ